MYQHLEEEQMTIYNVEQRIQRQEINISPMLCRDSTRTSLCYNISFLESGEEGWLLVNGLRSELFHLLTPPCVSHTTRDISLFPILYKHTRNIVHAVGQIQLVVSLLSTRCSDINIYTASLLGFWWLPYYKTRRLPNYLKRHYPSPICYIALDYIGVNPDVDSTKLPQIYTCANESRIWPNIFNPSWWEGLLWTYASSHQLAPCA